MNALELEKGLWCIFLQEEPVHAFDISSYMDQGTSRNTYLLKSDGKTVLFETLPERSACAWLDALESIVGSDTIDYLVLNSNRFDCESVRLLLARYPDLIVVSSAYSLYCLRETLGSGFRNIETHSKDKLSVGSKSLRFMVQQNTCLPLSMYTVLEDDKIVINADILGAHITTGVTHVSELGDTDEYLRCAERFFHNEFGLIRRNTIMKAMDDILLIEPRLVLCTQGPVIDAGLDKLFERYAALCSVGEFPTHKVIAIPYADIDGNVRKLAENIALGISDAGEGGETIEARLYDLRQSNREDVLKELSCADAYLFGSSVITGNAMKALWDVLTSMYAEDYGFRPAAVFGTCDEDDSALPHVAERLEQLALTVRSGLFAPRIPGETDFRNAYEFGYNISCIMQKKVNPHMAGKLVKCLVCGEIFDASLEVCPVCGVGLDKCVEAEDLSVNYHRDSDTRYLILGGGPAAAAAAAAIRDRDSSGSITMVSAETYKPINRIALSKELTPELALEDGAEMIALKPAEWYEENRITLLLGKTVASLDAAGKVVSLESGEVLPYDKLIYALGAEPAVPPIPGRDKSEVITIRHLSDIRRLFELMKGARNVVVIGGGVIGLEMAWELYAKKLNVTVLDVAPKLIGAKVNDAVAAMLLDACEAVGVSARVGVNITEIEGDGRVTGVRLSDGTSMPADFVIMSCGNRANIAVATAAGIAAGRAIYVNERMETNIRDIYSCGDCAQFDNVNCQLCTEAQEQGRIAGANAAGDCLSFKNIPLGLSYQGLTELYSIGDIGQDANTHYKTVELRDDKNDCYEKYWFVDDRIRGALLFGSVDNAALATMAVTNQTSFNELF